MQARISASLLKTLKPDAKPYEVADVDLTGFLLRVQPSGTMSYVVQYARGKRVTLGKTTKLSPAQARDHAEQLLADAVKGIDHQSERRKAKADTLGQFVEEIYVPHVEQHHANPRTTLDALRRTFKAFLGRSLSDIKPYDIDRWRGLRLKEVSPATTNRELTSLKACLNFAVARGVIAANPITIVKQLPEHLGAPRYLTDEEETRLRVALAENDAQAKRARESANEWRRARGYELLPEFGAYVDHFMPMVLVSLNTGMRLGELTKLQWSRVFLESRTLRIEAVTSKGRKERLIPLNDEALRVLTAWKAQSDDLNGFAFPVASIKTAWRTITRQADIKARWHDLRHTFASRLVQRGASLAVVRELLGHSDFKLTQRYAISTESNRLAAVELLDGAR
jgi:integrase